MIRPHSQLVITGRLPSQESEINTFMQSLKTSPHTLHLTFFSHIVQATHQIQREITERGLTTRQMKGSCVIHRPAVYPWSPEKHGLYNTFRVEITRDKGSWLLTGAQTCQCTAGQQAQNQYHLTKSAIKILMDKALRDVVPLN